MKLLFAVLLLCVSCTLSRSVVDLTDATFEKSTTGSGVWYIEVGDCVSGFSCFWRCSFGSHVERGGLRYTVITVEG
jgi:hypothetical protein